MALNDWSISQELLNWITENVPKGLTILELGSGAGTEELAKFYTMFSVEHNPNFLNKYKSTYIYAPIYNNWYDIRFNRLPVKYDVLLIDGPTGNIGRIGFADHFDKFRKDCIVIVDDVNRKQEYELSKLVAKWKSSEPIKIDSGNKKTDIYL